MAAKRGTYAHGTRQRTVVLEQERGASRAARVIALTRVSLRAEIKKLRYKTQRPTMLQMPRDLSPPCHRHRAAAYPHRAGRLAPPPAARLSSPLDHSTTPPSRSPPLSAISRLFLRRYFSLVFASVSLPLGRARLSLPSSAPTRGARVSSPPRRSASPGASYRLLVFAPP